LLDVKYSSTLSRNTLINSLSSLLTNLTGVKVLINNNLAIFFANVPLKALKTIHKHPVLLTELGSTNGICHTFAKDY